MRPRPMRPAIGWLFRAHPSRATSHRRRSGPALRCLCIAHSRSAPCRASRMVGWSTCRDRGAARSTERMQPVAAPMQGTVVSIDVSPGDAVRVGQPVVVLESMKMEHVVAAEWAGTIASIGVEVGQTVMPGDALVLIEPGEGASADAEVEGAAVDL